MNDLISRKALIAEYDRVHIRPPGGARKLIEDAPAVREWIPVSERLPEEDQEVLCYMGNFIGTLMDVYTYKGDNKWEDTYGNWNYTDIEGITHWMQLPQPPKEES